MPKTATAKIFMSGRSQALRLPKEFRLPGKEVQVTQVPGGLLLTPLTVTAEEWAIEMAAFGNLSPVEIPIDRPIDWDNPFGDKVS